MVFYPVAPSYPRGAATWCPSVCMLVAAVMEQVVAHSLHTVLFSTSGISENRGYHSHLPIVVVTMIIVEMSVF